MLDTSIMGSYALEVTYHTTDGQTPAFRHQVHTIDGFMVRPYNTIKEIIQNGLQLPRLAETDDVIVISPSAIERFRIINRNTSRA